MRGLVLLWWAVAHCWRGHAATVKPSSEHTQPPQPQTNTEDTDQQQLLPETSPWTQTTPWDQPTLRVNAPAVPGLQLQLRAAASAPAATQADEPVQTPQPDDQEQSGGHGGTAQPTTHPTGPTHADNPAHGQQAQPEEPPQQQQPPPQTSPGGSFGPGERNNDPWGYYAPAYDPDTDPWHRQQRGGATTSTDTSRSYSPRHHCSTRCHRAPTSGGTPSHTTHRCAPARCANKPTCKHRSRRAQNHRSSNANTAAPALQPATAHGQGSPDTQYRNRGGRTLNRQEHRQAAAAAQPQHAAAGPEARAGPTNQQQAADGAQGPHEPIPEAATETAAAGLVGPEAGGTHADPTPAACDPMETAGAPAKAQPPPQPAQTEETTGHTQPSADTSRQREPKPRDQRATSRATPDAQQQSGRGETAEGAAAERPDGHMGVNVAFALLPWGILDNHRPEKWLLLITATSETAKRPTAGGRLSPGVAAVHQTVDAGPPSTKSGQTVLLRLGVPTKRPTTTAGAPARSYIPTRSVGKNGHRTDPATGSRVEAPAGTAAARAE